MGDGKAGRLFPPLGEGWDETVTEIRSEAKSRERIADIGEAVDIAVRRAQDYLLSIRYPDGYWWGELETNVCMAAEYLLLTHFLGVADRRRWDKIVNYLRRQQLPDGTWSIYYGGPGDLNATVEAYFALKLAGASPEEPAMEKARQFILSKGGIPKVRIFTKIWLALFGQWDWRGVPVLPPELMLLPSWFPINIYEFGSWARATIVSMLIILTRRPVCSIPGEARIDELYPAPRDQIDYSLPKGGGLLSWKTFFLATDKLLRFYERWGWKPIRRRATLAAEKWILDHQEADGSWKFAWRQLTSVEHDYAFAFALRLPSGAHSVSAHPPATETKVSASSTTLLWRCMRAANQAFECEVKYRLAESVNVGG